MSNLNIKSVLILDKNIYIPFRLYVQFEILIGPNYYL